MNENMSRAVVCALCNTLIGSGEPTVTWRGLVVHGGNKPRIRNPFRESRTRTIESKDCVVNASAKAKRAAREMLEGRSMAALRTLYPASLMRRAAAGEETVALLKEIHRSASAHRSALDLSSSPFARDAAESIAHFVMEVRILLKVELDDKATRPLRSVPNGAAVRGSVVPRMQ